MSKIYVCSNDKDMDRNIDPDHIYYCITVISKKKCRKIYFEMSTDMDNFIKQAMRMQKFKNRLSQYKIVEKLELINAADNDKIYRATHRMTQMKLVMKIKKNFGVK